MWKTVSVNENYEVNEVGEVRYKGKDILKTAYINKDNGYLYVQLWDAKMDTNHRMPIHRLVATAFIPNPENKPTVDHINHIRTDNRVENLRWATYLEQNTTEDGVGIRSIPIKATHKNGQVLHFPSMVKACEYFNADRTAIEKSIKYKRMVVKGKTKGWFFEQECEEQKCNDYRKATLF